MLLGAGGGLLALLGAYVVIRRRRAAQGETALGAMSTRSQPGNSLMSNSIFRSTGGQSVDTSHAPAQTDFTEAGELTYIGEYYPSVAVLDEKIHLFIARKLSFHSQHTDEDEFLHVEQRPLKDVVEQVMRGEIPDGKTQTAILKAWNLLKSER